MYERGWLLYIDSRRLQSLTREAERTMSTIFFDSRVNAARRLVKALSRYRGHNPLVLAIPRGAVEMGRVIADELGGDLDVVLVRKLRSPFNPEFAVGSLDETGWTYVGEQAAAAGADAAFLEEEKRRQLDTLRKRRALYTPQRPPIDAKDRLVIVVDDGLATGATMIAALHAARAKHPRRLVCAVPVAAPDSLERVRPYADEIVCLDAPPEFYAVAQFYGEFHQVEDEEVTALLNQPAKQPGEGAVR
jgi:predicted phosphoribosyltransferase